MPPKQKSNAAAMRKSREKMRMDPARYEEYKRKERTRYQKRKDAGKLTNINTLNFRDQRSLRRKWKKQKQEQRKKKIAMNPDVPILMNTPPLSPNEMPAQIQNNSPSNNVTVSKEKKSGRKLIRRENRKSYRTITKQNAQIAALRNKIKSLSRQLGKYKSSKLPGNKVQKKLLFEVLPAPSKSKKSIKSIQKGINSVAVCKILRKYRLIRKTKAVTSSLRKKPQGNFANSFQHVKDAVQTFFLEDVNSEQSAGKKETKTQKKIKMQKRYMLDTMVNLHQKFLSENPTLNISYTSFTRLRPFYVVAKNVNSRDTVKCKLHANCEFKAETLYSVGVTASSNPFALMQDIVCSVNNFDCMYSKCDTCKPNFNQVFKQQSKNSEVVVSYSEWQDKLETNIKKGVEKITKISIKVKENKTVCELIPIFLTEFKKLMKHQYRFFHQYRKIKDMKLAMGNSTCILQVDFSENYQHKLGTEIQSLHFGGSRKQTTLHTCHATLKNEHGKVYIKCYCTLSDDTRHTAESIWAHLAPVVCDLRSLGVSTIHFVSDGPTSQYRNKTLMYMLTVLPKKWGMKFVSWNYLEAHHGKGPADGIGASIKNKLDRLVAQGKDMTSTAVVFNAIEDQVNVKLFEVTSDEINNMCSLLDLSGVLLTVKGTMEIHQVWVTGIGKIEHRELSCFCNNGVSNNNNCQAEDNQKMCRCYSPNCAEIVSKHNDDSLDMSDQQVLSPLDSIEQVLTDEQINKFNGRLTEESCYTVENLAMLSNDEQKEYMYWVTWRSLKLSDGVSAQNGALAEVGGMCSPDISSSEHVDVNIGEYYAVYFTVKHKPLFYIGRCLSVRNNGADAMYEVTFLEKNLLRNTYDWPRRPDICQVAQRFFLKRISFLGPPPFAISEEQKEEIHRSMQSYVAN